jgi:hypothetical protein
MMLQGRGSIGETTHEMAVSSSRKAHSKACCIVCFFYVNCEADEVINVNNDDASCVDWDVDDEVATNSEWDVVWKKFLGWDMFLGVCGIKREWVPIVVMEDCVDQIADRLQYC